MARRGRGLGLPRVLTFGDRVAPSLGLVLALMLAASVWGWLDPAIQDAAALAPTLVARGEVWRIFTWPFVQRDPFALLFGGFMLYWLGQQLGFVWSERRFLARILAYTVVPGAATTLVALGWSAASTPHWGIWPVVNALIVSWAMLYPDRMVNVWGVLPITGRAAAWLVLGGTILYGLAGGGVLGIGAFTVHLAAIALAWLLARGLGAGRSWRDARAWWAERDAKRRARHLKVVKREGEDDRPRWLN